MEACDTLWGYWAADQWLGDSIRLNATSHDYLFSPAQGRPGRLGFTCMPLCRFRLRIFAQWTVGVSRPPVFPAPSDLRATRQCKKLGQQQPRDRGAAPAVSGKSAHLLSKSIMIAPAKPEPNHLVPFRTCARPYRRNNIALRCGLESTRPGIPGGWSARSLPCSGNRHCHFGRP